MHRYGTTSLVTKFPHVWAAALTFLGWLLARRRGR